MRRYRDHCIRRDVWDPGDYIIELDGLEVKRLPASYGLDGARGWIDRAAKEKEAARYVGYADPEREAEALAQLRAATDAARPLHRREPRQLGILEVLECTIRITILRPRRRARQRRPPTSVQMVLPGMTLMHAGSATFGHAS